MHIEHTHGVWHVIDHTHKTVTRDTNITRALQNALYKYQAFKNTEQPQGNLYELLSSQGIIVK